MMPRYSRAQQSQRINFRHRTLTGRLSRRLTNRDLVRQPTCIGRYPPWSNRFGLTGQATLQLVINVDCLASCHQVSSLSMDEETTHSLAQMIEVSRSLTIVNEAISSELPSHSHHPQNARFSHELGKALPQGSSSDHEPAAHDSMFH